MNFNKNIIYNLGDFINLINNMLDEDNELENVNQDCLYKYGSEEEIILLLKTLDKIKKKNIKKAIKLFERKQNVKNINNQNKIKEVVKNKYLLDEIISIFKNFSNDDIMDKYNGRDLSEMYLCIYAKKPSSSKTKSDIISDIKKYINSLNRANSFKW